MKKEEFVDILNKNCVPIKLHNKYWEDWSEYHFKFCIGEDALNIFLDNIAEKKSYEKAPW